MDLLNTPKNTNRINKKEKRNNTGNLILFELFKINLFFDITRERINFTEKEFNEIKKRINSLVENIKPSLNIKIISDQMSSYTHMEKNKFKKIIKLIFIYYNINNIDYIKEKIRKDLRYVIHKYNYSKNILAKVSLEYRNIPFTESQEDDQQLIRNLLLTQNKYYISPVFLHNQFLIFCNKSNIETSEPINYDEFIKPLHDNAEAIKYRETNLRIKIK